MPAASAPRSLDAAIEALRKSFDPAAAAGLSAVYQLDLSGHAGGDFYVRIEDGQSEIERGRAAAADVLFRLPAEDYFAVLAGRENADLLYMAGRLEIEGDLSLAMKLRTLFRSPA